MSNPTLAATINARFADLTAAMQPYAKDGSYVPYTNLTAEQVRELAQGVGALAEPLSQVASNVVGRA